MHEAFARSERLKRHTSLDAGKVLADMKLTLASSDSPERNVASRELKSALEAPNLSLPRKYRTVITVRDVELSTAEAARLLEISAEAVKVRLHRARALVGRALYPQSGVCARELFPFRATRCDRVVAAVLARIREFH
jgi:RNA polymerase sigma-70 factor (ECF subfamily)